MPVSKRKKPKYSEHVFLLTLILGLTRMVQPNKLNVNTSKAVRSHYSACPILTASFKAQHENGPMTDNEGPVSIPLPRAPRKQAGPSPATTATQLSSTGSRSKGLFPCSHYGLTH